ncbi:hypothetical protein BDK51DRAFT_46922 [Blyttiomyces helicus]|uniref:UBZ4-type domain-containing protein n=1 Tax=Blyttiomyces helicus TaxID=388810 RepID=A0A4P9W566_9FUNG|nr:hypothetical protein BDK51DRAFT_46922 [Blyttiomyces helicus]|eukprot:RKO86453.1 hypothetical protein BDK51DRAFT_46922 [Blyttiomyces helicus]
MAPSTSLKRPAPSLHANRPPPRPPSPVLAWPPPKLYPAPSAAAAAAAAELIATVGRATLRAFPRTQVEADEAGFATWTLAAESRGVGGVRASAAGDEGRGQAVRGPVSESLAHGAFPPMLDEFMGFSFLDDDVIFLQAATTAAAPSPNPPPLAPACEKAPATALAPSPRAHPPLAPACGPVKSSPPLQGSRDGSSRMEGGAAFDFASPVIGRGQEMAAHPPPRSPTSVPMVRPSSPKPPPAPALNAPAARAPVPLPHPRPQPAVSTSRRKPSPAPVHDAPAARVPVPLPYSQPQPAILTSRPNPNPGSVEGRAPAVESRDGRASGRAKPKPRSPLPMPIDLAPTMKSRGGRLSGRPNPKPRSPAPIPIDLAPSIELGRARVSARANPKPRSPSPILIDSDPPVSTTHPAPAPPHPSARAPERLMHPFFKQKAGLEGSAPPRRPDAGTSITLPSAPQRSAPHPPPPASRPTSGPPVPARGGPSAAPHSRVTTQPAPPPPTLQSCPICAKPFPPDSSNMIINTHIDEYLRRTRDGTKRSRKEPPNKHFVFMAEWLLIPCSRGSPIPSSVAEATHPFMSPLVTDGLDPEADCENGSPEPKKKGDVANLINFPPNEIQNEKRSESSAWAGSKPQTAPFRHPPQASSIRRLPSQILPLPP